MRKFIIIGSGRRVQQDLLPSLSHLGIHKSIISIYAKREKNILVRNDNYKVNELKKLKSLKDKSIVYIAVSKNAVEFVTKFITQLNPNIKIIIDTPIYSKSFVNQFKNINISVAEDAFFLGKYLINSNLKLKRFNFLLLYKSAFSYHGIAFIESLLSKIIFQVSFYNFYFAFSRKGISIIFGKKNYEKGNIYLNFSKIKFPILSKKEEKLIGGFSDYDSVSYRFLDLKRLGLVDLLKYRINNKGFLSIEMCYKHFKKGEIIGKSPLIFFFNKINNAFKKSI
jgi:hypothetical protein